MTKKHSNDVDVAGARDWEPLPTVSSQETVEVTAEQLESVRAQAREDAPFVVPADFRLSEADLRELNEGPVVIRTGDPITNLVDSTEFGDPNAMVLGLIDRLTRADQTHEISSAVQCLRNASRWLVDHETKGAANHTNT